MTAAIFVLFAQDLLDLSDRWYGLLIAIGAIGAVAGGLVAERLSKRLGSLSSTGTVIVWILCMFAEGFWPRLWVSAITTMAMAFGTTVWNTVTVLPLVQRIVPVNLFGLVNSVYRWLVWGSISIGSAFGGLVAPRVRIAGAILHRRHVRTGGAHHAVLLDHAAVAGSAGRHAGHRRRHTRRDGHRSLPVARMTSEASSEMHVAGRAPARSTRAGDRSSLLSAEAYTDAAWFAAERQMIFGDGWVWAGYEHWLAEIGDVPSGHHRRAADRAGPWPGWHRGVPQRVPAPWRVALR